MTLKLDGLWRLCSKYRASLGWTPHPFSVPACFTGRLWAGGQRRLANAPSNCNHREAPAPSFCGFFRDRFLQKKVPFQELGSSVPQPSPRFVKVESAFAGDLQVERNKVPFLQKRVWSKYFFNIDRMGRGLASTKTRI